ncbi:GNAT family N-acetyltransferase [Parachitinimonas caeni]|uniref:GNAT family N-acetyltransferase n=1 Tax=Parachitinimonas caeni TaxID=3031301 RepID=A0ABT7DYS8_9NEIS|nr:GNAT family N-acetyltransferase [Parachitinimonas caeni]MDK2125221.1 GNAT family N-acetyltransferase [Parachitinimonas caeni]
MTYQIRPAVVADHDALLELIARCQRNDAQHCLHFDRTAEGIASDLIKDDMDLVEGWWLAEQDGRLTAAFGLSPDEDEAYVYGPWSDQFNAESAHDRELRRALIATAMHEHGYSKITAFVDQRAPAIIEDLQAAGLPFYNYTQVMRCEQPALQRVEPPTGVVISPFEATQRLGVTQIHDAEFAHTWLDAEGLIERAAKEGSLLVATNSSGEVLGYAQICRIPEQAEFDLNYLAVSAGNRGHGLGAALLDAALQWAWQQADCEAVNLTVTSVNQQALRLYESRGFQLVYVGVGMIWEG